MAVPQDDFQRQRGKQVLVAGDAAHQVHLPDARGSYEPDLALAPVVADPGGLVGQVRHTQQPPIAPAIQS